MSQRYPGGFITKTPTAPTSSAAPGIWTVDQAMQNQKAGNWPAPPSPYIEDYFSTYLYTGNGSTQTITNGIDLSGKGGMVWGKSRAAATAHNLYDTVRGASNRLAPNLTNAQANTSPRFSSFNTNGFSLDGASDLNNSSDSIVSWTFRKQPKFFDVVTYTGNGTAGRTVSHNLGSAPGCIIIKRTDTSSNWLVYHQSLGIDYFGKLESTDQFFSGNSDIWNFTNPTSTQFTVGSQAINNASGGTYVAYLFAHNAGGFGLTGSDNVISCGSVTADGAGSATVNLGYEPQWLLVKSSSEVNSWAIVDTMRGLPADGSARFLFANTSGAESGGGLVNINATGFYANATLSASATYIYIAIRRGPMKVPTVGTSVYGAVARAGTGANATVTTGSFPPDLTIIRGRDAGYSWRWGDRLRGTPFVLRSNVTNAELTGEADLSSFNMGGFSLTGTGASLSNSSGVNYINYAMGRAPGFFDEVCWSGDGVSNRALAHNLGVAPELIITKKRTTAGDWQIYNSFTAIDYARLVLNTSAANTTGITYGFGVNLYSQPTSSNIYLTPFYPNSSGETFVAYLFATVAGVSKVGTYTGTAALLTVNCGFTTGARFVLIKRTDSTGDWYVYDSARGISSSTDPYLLLNDTAAEVTGTNYVDTDTTGFKVTAAAPAGLNASAGTYIFLAIA